MNRIRKIPSIAISHIIATQCVNCMETDNRTISELLSGMGVIGRGLFEIYA